MLTEAVNELISEDLNAGKSNLLDYINATITLEDLASKLNKSSKSLHRMPGPGGNPGVERIYLKSSRFSRRVNALNSRSRLVNQQREGCH